MDWGKYNIIRTKEALIEADQYLMDGQNPKFELISVDTETNGLSFKKNVVVGFSFSTDSKSGFYVPLLDWTPKPESLKTRKVNKKSYESYMEGYLRCVWTGENYEEFCTPQQYQPPEFIKFFLERWFTHPSVGLIMHNAPFDCLMIDSNFGVDLTKNLFVDTLLMKHVLDENSSMGLKETALLWQKRLNLDVEGQANKEKLVLGKSIIKNGGKSREMWRGEPHILGKYAVADTFLTFAVYEAAMAQFAEKFSDQQLDWFFKDEVMPLCREVVIPLRKYGARINLPYFQGLEEETRKKLDELEDQIIQTLEGPLKGFDKGESLEKAVSKKAFITRIMELEGLKHPTITKKGVTKESLSKPAVKKAYQEEPHWLWGYILGEDEIKYSEDKVKEIKLELYRKAIKRRHRFNIRSNDHLRWLFCEYHGVDPKQLPQTDSATPEKVIPSMSAEVLKTHFLDKFDWVKTLLLYKKNLKLYSTYITPAINLQHNGYLHVNFNQAGTISGRFSCSGGFNLQTLPAVEELATTCPQCGSDLEITYEIELLADEKCTNEDCGYTREDILCPSAIKKGFIAPEDYVIINADYSSLEPRCFAFCSGDDGLKDVYKKGWDLYSTVYIDTEEPNGPYSKHPKDENFLKKLAPKKRTMVKPGVLGVPYGSGAWQLAKIMNFKKTIEDRKTGEPIEIVDADRGQAWIDKYLNTYPNLHKYMLKQEVQAVTKGYVETLVGRRRHFKFTKPVYELISKDGVSISEFMSMKRDDLEVVNVKGLPSLNFENLTALSTQCGFNMKDKKGQWRTWSFIRAMFKNEFNNSKNAPIQGLAAHITNRAMLDMQREFNEKGLRAQVVLNVHDEITCYAHKDDAEEAVEIHQRCMETNKYAMLIDVPMIAEPVITNTLKDAK